MVKTTSDSLGDRMKSYEAVSDIRLPIRMPTIVRVDGSAFHTLTKGCTKPWDAHFVRSMLETAFHLCTRLQGAKLAYVQSDEISVLLTDYDDINTQPWLDKRVQKMTSHSAGIASRFFGEIYGSASAFFDSRVFVLPKEDVCNYFVWRQQDATRNSIQGLGQSKFSHKEMQGLNNDQVQDKLFLEKGINWNDLPIILKRGAVIRRRYSSDPAYDGRSINLDLLGTTYVMEQNSSFLYDLESPIFTQDRNYVERYVYLFSRSDYQDQSNPSSRPE